MTHTGPMSESQGDFRDWKPASRKCDKCQGDVQYRTWESHCGGYEDLNFRCTSCRHEWWVDGIDS